LHRSGALAAEYGAGASYIGAVDDVKRGSGHQVFANLLLETVSETSACGNTPSAAVENLALDVGDDLRCRLPAEVGEHFL
jgi:hypothetical protein